MLKRTGSPDKRQFGSRHTQVRAWIRVSGRPPVQCTISDVSNAGAVLDCDETVWLPFAFRLVTDDKSIDRVCEIRHEIGRRKDVEFVDQVIQTSDGPKPSSDDDWGGRRSVPQTR
ncbi:MAG: hypothetical protein R3D51_07435 [Hyphomicrobiaceae bacterium]